MIITPLAAESMGGRSLATWVETGDCRIIIDPWLAEAPIRFGLGPHPVEKWNAEKLKSRIRLYLRSAEVVILTHYDDASFSLLTPDMCRDKTIFLRNPNQNTLLSHRNAAFEFIGKVRDLVQEFSYVDGKTLRFRDTRIRFCTSVPGDQAPESGFVMPLAVTFFKERFFYSSQLAGVFGQAAARFCKDTDPHICLLDGPETTWRKDSSELQILDDLIVSLMGVLCGGSLHTLIIDHHLMRDSSWQKKIRLLYKLAGEKEVTVKTGAEFRGEENNMLEARREKLYEADGPS